jgi:membrane protein
MHLAGLTLRGASLRTWSRIGDHAILTRAAAVSFYAIAALIPFFALVIALSAHLLPWIMRKGGEGAKAAIDPLQPMRDLLPADAVTLIGRELERLQNQPPTGIISFGLVALLWLSSTLFVEIIDALNAIKCVPETRPFWKRRLIAMLMTLSEAAILLAAVVTIVVWPQISAWLGLKGLASILATLIHVVTVFGMVLLSFALALYFGPDADQHWEWITPGSLLGSCVLLLVSLLFRVYAQNWGNYSATYGSLAGIIVLMSWLWLCSLELLVAAEFNKVIEDASPLDKSRVRKGKAAASTAIP